MVVTGYLAMGIIYDTPPPSAQELAVVASIDEVRTSVRYALRATKRWHGLLRRSVFGRNIQGSNTIEGYNVTVEDAIAAVEGEEPLEADDEAWAAVVGYRNAMSYVLQLSDDPHFNYSESLLRSLHYMMLQHDLSKNPGRWRPGYIAVRNEQTGEVVYEGPDADLVPSLISALVESLDAPDKGAPAMIRAAMAHLNLAMIHPFSDGNGRMARCLQTLVLAREGILEPQFCSVEEYLGRHTQEYYQVLAQVGQEAWHPNNDPGPWIRFSLTAHYRQAKTILRRIRETERLWDELERLIASHGLPERTIFALAEAAWGRKVRNATYRPIAEITENLASRDLAELVARGLLVPQGEKRGRYYVASDFIKAIRSKTREPRLPIEDPFDLDKNQPGLFPR